MATGDGPNTPTVDMEHALQWTKGNPEAAKLILDLFKVGHLADNIYDNDSEDVSGDLAKLVAVMFTSISLNPFFINHRATLAPLMSICGAKWDTTNKLRKHSNSNVRKYAFVTKGVDDFLYMIALLCGGYDHAVSLMLYLTEEYYKNSETFNEWELRHGIM